MKKVTARYNEGSSEKIKEYLSSFDGVSFLDHDIREAVFYVNDGALDKILNELTSLLDLRYKENLIEVQTLDFVVSTSLDKSHEKDAAKEKTPVEKLIDQTKRYTIFEYGKVTLTAVAGLIAMMGLFMNNIPIIIGAMLLSPMLGPIYAFAINTSVGRIQTAARGVSILLLLLGAAIGIVFVFTSIAEPLVNLPITTEQIQFRLVPNFLYVPLGILLGFASMLAMGRDVQEVFAGVAISVALVPPAAVSGIMLAVDPSIAYIPLIIVAQNALGMMVGALLAIVILKIGPRKYYAKSQARKYIVRILLIVAVLLALTLLVGLSPSI